MGASRMKKPDNLARVLKTYKDLAIKTKSPLVAIVDKKAYFFDSKGNVFKLPPVQTKNRSSLVEFIKLAKRNKKGMMVYLGPKRDKMYYIDEKGNAWQLPASRQKAVKRTVPKRTR